MENEAIVRRLYEEVWNKHKVELVDELMSPSYAIHNIYVPGPRVGPEAYKRQLTRFITAFPDMTFTIADMIAGKDRVVVSWILSGTHKGTFRGLPPTDRKVSMDGITITHIANGKITDSHVTYDMLVRLRDKSRLSQSADDFRAIQISQR